MCQRGKCAFGAWILLALSMSLWGDELSFQAVDVGVSFKHDHGGCGRRFFVEQVGGGVLVFDADGDGWMDLYFLSGRALPGCPTGASADAPGERNSRFYQNLAGKRFEERTREVGLETPAYAVGGAVGDIDNDGDPDVYVTCYGKNLLFRNDGERFEEIGMEAGVADRSFGTSATFFDFDGDGDLDLYVCNYVEVTRENHPDCLRRNLPVYCLPQDFPAAADRFYRNDGKGAFRDVTKESGVLSSRGRGLGVVVADLDNDSDADIYVANDATDNFLFWNQGNGTFREGGLLAGVALSEDGVMENGMGTDAADVDGDGWIDLVVSNFSMQTNTIYRNLGDGYFTDVTDASGTAAVSLAPLGWATLFDDFDGDGRFDLFVANGHVFDNIAELEAESTFAQRNLFFRSTVGVRFEPLDVGFGNAPRRPSRGAASVDYDNDGDLDLIVSNVGAPATVLRNDAKRTGPWLAVRCRGRESNRDAIGARLRLRVADRTIVREVRGARGYLSQCDPRVWLPFAVGADAMTIEVEWPVGKREQFTISARHAGETVELRQGTGRS